MSIADSLRLRLSRAVALLALVLGAFAAAPALARADFQLGLQDQDFFYPATATASRAGFRALQTIAGSTIRLTMLWNGVAPGGDTIPAGFVPTDPADPHYNWIGMDQALRTAAEHHARVVLDLTGAPAWAQPSGEPMNLTTNYPYGAWDPSAVEFGEFARAAALRYSGHFPDPLHPGSYLPRVSDWEIWNEENLPYDLSAPNLVAEYRSLLNAAYGAIKSVHAGNLVAIGGLAPVSFIPGLSVAPLTFAAQLMCLRRVGTRFVRGPSCPQRAHFDVFAMHPYSEAATPTKHAYLYDNVLVGDMGKIADIVRAADALHTVAPQIKHQIWVTEWSWFTNPPQKIVGDAAATAARYVAYSMYEMWRAGVSLVIWFTIADQPGAAESPSFINGGGLYTSSGRPKLTLQAFRFPVVASVARGHGLVWGRAPVSKPVRVTVQRAVGRRWRALATVRTGADGVFNVRFHASHSATYRAVVFHGPASLAYDSTPIPAKRTHLFDSG